MCTFSQTSENPSNFCPLKRKSLDISASRSGPPRELSPDLAKLQDTFCQPRRNSRGGDDLGPVTDTAGRVQGRTVTISFRAQESLNEFSDPMSQLGVQFFYQIVGVVPPDSSYSTHDYTATDYGISSSEPFIGRYSADMCFEDDRGLGEEHDRVQLPHIDRKAHEKVDDDGDGDDDDHDDIDDAGDEEQSVLVAPLATASRSDERLRHGKGKGLTGSFMSVMSKISGSHNKRSDKAHDIPAPTQRKKGGPVDPELIPSYGGMWQVRYGVDRYISLS
ncbi:hypothetical protein M9H77_32527 [Catharanthus roseus]|uniref:Uncharacterized protein n=1 Tax=Catharanthus roseus TaxID=4058 RepID=A0ACC0A517_CATRO|nr:hypothetical protein M9H77_32527 [Catharanthus roseus]